MTTKCSVYCGASLDGFIAGLGGDIEWLHRPEFADASVTGVTYDQFIASVDAIVMGRHTFEKLLTFNVWPYKLPVVVLATSLRDLPEHVRGKARLMAGSPEEVVQRLASEGRRHLYVDGGTTIQRFIRARLINEITVTYLPVLLGGGIPLFGSIGAETRLKLLGAVSHNDIVQLRYQLVNLGG